MANMTLISSVTVGSGGASNIQFTSIPQTYTDLVVRLSCRTNATNGYFIEQLFMRLNNDSTSGNYSWVELASDGSSAYSGTNTSDDRIYVDFAPCATATSNTFSNTEIYLSNYTVAQHKPVNVNRAAENNATQTYQGFVAGLWRSNSSVTSISIIPNQANTLVQYSTAYLYGISNA